MTPAIQAISLISPLAMSYADHGARLMAGQCGLEAHRMLLDGRSVAVGALPAELPPLPGSLRDWESRSNRLVAALIEPLSQPLQGAIERWGAERVAVVIGCTTSGIAESEPCYGVFAREGVWPPSYRYTRQELGDPARFAAHLTGVGGPCYVVSTACTSGAKAMVSAALLLEAGLCDAALCGGVDTLCGLTLNGFAALEAISEEPCLPFSSNRQGISIGEGGALFLLDREPGALRLAGWGESCDAYHFSAPDPEGVGAELAIRAALDTTGVGPGDIGYINLHGTGTALNDRVEALVTHRLFGADVACGSTKGMTGHMLGAAGACEAVFVAIALQQRAVPPHVWDEIADPELPPINLVPRAGGRCESRHMMSCSYAFGGNNCALVLARE
jgi:3-oxoacyl-[acyl-carrier-protein] synthase-1